MSLPPLLDRATLHARYAAGARAEEVIAAAYERLAKVNDPGIFIHLVPRETAMTRVAALPAFDPARYPLWGLPVAVKDNIDVAGLPTTAGCPAYAYVPDATAPAAQRLLDAGAVLVGKTNLDQFATGLVGVRTPYPVPRNARDPARVPGGSSSGSAVAVARGIVSLALGTDTAGSGRVPAALNGIVGLKPSLGAVSSRGVVPACRSLDCVSVFAANVADAWAGFSVIAGQDAEDPFSRPVPLGPWAAPQRVGVPRVAELDGAEAVAAWEAALARLRAPGVSIVPINMAEFHEAARLLYDGPWVAERAAAVGEFVAAHPDVVHPVTRGILAGAARFSAVDAFRGFYRLQELKRRTARVWAEVEALAVPSVPNFPTLAELQADPLGPNARLGAYTNFVNLLDLAAIAVPGPARPDGLPGGATFIGPRGGGAALAALGAWFEESV